MPSRIADLRQNNDLRYLLVAIGTGLLNLGIVLLLKYGFNIHQEGWFDVELAGMIGIGIGIICSFLGHEFLDYGRNGSHRVWWLHAAKFLLGLAMNLSVYYTSSSIINTKTDLPFIAVHISALVIGFLFFWLWNRAVTFSR